jgi:FkbM family methyltransferase
MNLDFLQKYFIPVSILDIGANRGQFYQEAKLTFPNAYYCLIEANPECEEALKQLNIEYHIKALSDTERTALFYKSKIDAMGTGNSLYRENTSYYTSENVIITECETTTLEKLLQHQSFDLIKLDVQGSELDIMKGGLSVVRKAKGIILEVSVMQYNENAPLEQEAYYFMQELGFEPKETIGAHFNPDTREFIQKDVFFLNQNL